MRSSSPGNLLRNSPGCRAGQRFGEKYLYKWWKRACKNLGIVGVDLYGGTRHSSAKALRRYRTPEEIKRATMHATNKAFERYFWMESDELRDIYRDAVEPRKQTKRAGKGKVLSFTKDARTGKKK